MRDEIQARYELNLQRVRKLVQVYRDVAPPGPGRRSVETTDLLRAAVVFLHATLEDVLRTLLAHRWPSIADSSLFVDIPIAIGPDARYNKVTLAELATLRGRTIDDLIRSSIEAHLGRLTFNHPGDVKSALARSGVDVGAMGPHAKELAALMSRRHQIVHRADRRDLGSTGKHTLASLGVATVDVWIAAVEALCQSIVAKL